MFIVLAVHQTTEGMVTLPINCSGSLGAARQVIPRINDLNSRSKVTDIFIYSVDPNTTYNEDGDPFKIHESFNSRMIDQHKRNWEWWRHKSVCPKNQIFERHPSSPDWFLYQDKIPFDLETDRAENINFETYHEEF